MTALCPVCRDPLPTRARDRRVLPNGVVLCDRATCEETASAATDCNGPGADRLCGRPVRASGLCDSHLSQRTRTGTLTPLRRRSPPGEQLARLTVRIPQEVIDALGDEPAQRAREVLVEWAGRRA